MSTERHDRIAARLEDYALGQLTSDEQRDVEAHVPACAACARDLREINEALVLLADSSPAIEPPASLKSRVIAVVAAQPQDPRLEPAFGRSKSGSRRWQWLSLAAAAALIVLAVMLNQTETARRQLARDLQRANADAGTLRDRLQRFSGQTDLALSILTAADMREVSLAGRENALAAAARAYWSPARGLLVVADRLPAPPPGRIYQVWVIDNGQPISAGLLGDQASGRGMLVAPPPRPGTGSAVTVAVTDEPPGGLTAPSGAIRLAGSI
jgi:anti-sigma-K factor RskA